MKCPRCKTGRLQCQSTRAHTAGRVFRYRVCLNKRCQYHCPTIETVLAIRSIPNPNYNIVNNLTPAKKSPC